MASLCYKYQERTWVLHRFIEFLLGLGHGPSFLGELQPPSCNDRSLHCVSTEVRGKYRATYPNGCASVEHAGSKQENKRPTATKEKQIQKTWRNRKRNDAETKGYPSVAYFYYTFYTLSMWNIGGRLCLRRIHTHRHPSNRRTPCGAWGCAFP